MNNWISKIINKEARRFKPNDRVRFFTQNRKGHGKGIVLTPNFQRGSVINYDSSSRRYIVNDGNENHEVHPRNIMPESFVRNESNPLNPVSDTGVNPEQEKLI